MINYQEGIILADEAAHVSENEVSATYSKVTWRLIPFFFACYVVAYLDRTNISFAQMQMKDALGFSDAVYGLGAGIFFIGYSLFEVPSNLILQKIGARKTLIRIMILWGLAGSAMIFVSSPAIFYILRFFLGAFEAGFVPGVIYYLTRWYPGARRGNILALFLLGMPISGVLGGPLAGWVLSSLHNSLGLQGWQWLFLIEGIPAVILGCMVYFLLDDEPAKAKWLSSRERAIVIRNVHAEQVNNGAGHGHSLGQALKDPRIYVMCLAYFTFISGIYAIGFWLPAMLKNAGIKDVFSIGLYSMIPFGVSALGMVIICRSSDRRLERRWHLALSAMVGAVTLAIIPATQASLGLSLVVMAVSTTAIYATLPMFWSIPSAYFAGTPAAAGSIAFINSLGLLGGLVSPVVIGWIKTTTGSMSNGLYAMSAMLIAGAVLMLLGIPAKAIRERAES